MFPSHAFSLVTNNPSNGGFQLYTSCNALVVAKIPSGLDFNSAAVLPLAISTAAACLFKKETLGLPMPTSSSKPSASGKSVLVWGGSSSVGATAIQLAAGAGHKVVSVASKHNLENVKNLGAAAVFDYNSSSVADDIIAALEGTEYAGVCDCIGNSDAAQAWAPVYKKLGGRYGSVMTSKEGFPEGIEGGPVLAPSVAGDDKYVGDAVWAKWVPEALESGALKALPGPVVIKGGLEAVQKGYEAQKKGVSFGKIVVEL
jgi:NADPH:quinone reductase-like Zn-dependent oxidoreductase